jgi:hypothetical protein
VKRIGLWTSPGHPGGPRRERPLGTRLSKGERQRVEAERERAVTSIGPVPPHQAARDPSRPAPDGRHSRCSRTPSLRSTLRGGAVTLIPSLARSPRMLPAHGTSSTRHPSTSSSPVPTACERHRPCRTTVGRRGSVRGMADRGSSRINGYRPSLSGPGSGLKSLSRAALWPGCAVGLSSGCCVDSGANDQLGGCDEALRSLELAELLLDLRPGRRLFRIRRAGEHLAKAHRMPHAETGRTLPPTGGRTYDPPRGTRRSLLLRTADIHPGRNGDAEATLW